MEQNEVSLRKYFTSHLHEYGLLIALIVIMTFFQILTGGTLLKPVNITNLFLQNSYIIIMALGMLIVIVAGHIDLSVGSVMGFIGALAAVMVVTWGMPIFITLPVCLVVGAVIGAMQGYWISYWKIPSFIVTLAGMLIFRGLSLWLLEGQSVGPFPSTFQKLSTGFISDLFPTNWGATLAPILGVKAVNIFALLVGLLMCIAILYTENKQRIRFQNFGMQVEPKSFYIGRLVIILGAILFVLFKLATFRGIPNVLVSMVILTLIYVFITERTVFGRRIYAIGGNEKAAKLSGVNTEKLVFISYINMGVLAALAGLIFAARLNSATPKAGFGVELDVIAAAFIGGASMSGGVGKVTGAVIGAFIMGVMNNGMSIMGIGIDYQQVIKGLVLLAAVIFDVVNKQKQR